MHDSHIVGWAHTRFGKSDAPDLESLTAEVSIAALEHAGLEVADVDAIFVGTFNAGLSRQVFEAALVGTGQSELGTVPATRVENACGTGSAALYAGLDLMAAGRAKVVLVVGAEKMTATPGGVVGDLLLGGSHLRTESAAGSFPGVFAGLADAYADRYGDPHDAMAQIAAKNHHNGVVNPFAHMQRDVGVEFCSTVSERNPVVVGRLLRTDCSLISDGAAALVLAIPDVSRTLPRAVAFAGRAHTNDHMRLAARADVLAFDGPARAFHGALDASGLTLADLDLLETHDCFTIAELLQYEAFGIAEPGKGAQALSEGRVQRDGTLPVNISGGLKAKGHPIGATGVSQHVMAAMQLTGEAGAMQLSTVDHAAVFNMGGAAVANYASVLKRAL